MKIITKNQSERGFTLIEVMIAVALLSVGILVVASMQANATRGNGNARRQTEATRLLVNRAELISQMPYNATGQIDTTTQPVVSGPFEITWEVEDEAPFTVSTTSGTTDFTVRRVTATVTWNNVMGLPKTINYTFLKAPPL